MKTPTAIDRRPVFPGFWAAFAQESVGKEAPRRPLGGTKEAPRRPQGGSDRPKMAPRWAQNDPERVQDGAQRDQDGSKDVYYLKLLRQMAPR